MGADWLVGFKTLLNVLYFRAVPVLVLSAVCFAVWWGIQRFHGPFKKEDTDIKSAALGFSFVGTAIGILVGASRTPISQDGLTGFLGLVTAFSAYAFAKDSLDKYRRYAFPILMTLSLSLIAGSYFGAAVRERGEDRASTAAQLQALAEARTEVCKYTATKIADSGKDPIAAMVRLCRLELGFIGE